jgi:hypothetical protein|uniref:Uncharacterized protein n=1 Tax=Siphoviridae sp. ctMAv2 TaxID=2826258 RepID=A0A8S5LSY0_9CAUD|nr:MAG TPA: hypothetical protein [Siphoviridae sp. ctMAv2]
MTVLHCHTLKKARFDEKKDPGAVKISKMTVTVERRGVLRVKKAKSKG